MQMVTVLGSTGSIGVNTLDVIARHPNKYSVFALTANSQSAVLLEQCKKFAPRYAVIANEKLASAFAADVRAAGMAVEVLTGVSGLEFVAAHDDVTTVMAAIVGFAGLSPTMAAVRTGKKVLLANKESLVCAGHLFMQTVQESGSTLLPIDSEHNAMFQCLPYGKNLGEAGVRRLLLTASGGPFRDFSFEQMRSVTPAQACAHPNWTMGRKISVDSASMMNKGLELIEACWLFNATPDQITKITQWKKSLRKPHAAIAVRIQPDLTTPMQPV